MTRERQERRNKVAPNCRSSFGIASRNKLRESNRNVATIALEVGYDSEAAFSRAFKRMVGSPPAAWRKAQIAA